MEEWRDIEGFEGYQVSDKGNVRSLDREIIYSNGDKHFYKGQILKQCLHSNGYLHVFLRKNNKQTIKLVHRLVAQAFIPNPDNLPQVNHKNEFDKTDNRVCSLEWCSSKYNMNYGTCLKRRAEKQSKKVYQYTLDGELIKIWTSLAECDKNGYKKSNVSGCCLGKKGYKTCKGFKWSYTPLEP